VYYTTENLSPAGFYWWIGLFPKDSDQYIWWSRATGASGSFTMDAPLQQGEYEFRWMVRRGISDTMYARSNIISVGTGTYGLSTNVATAAPGSDVAVSWTAPEGH